MLIQLSWRGEEPCLTHTALLTANGGERLRGSQAMLRRSWQDPSPSRQCASAPPGHRPLSPAAGPTCAYDHGDEGLGQRGPDSLPSPQPRQDPGHGAELCAGHSPRPFAHQQVKPKGWGPVPCRAVSQVSCRFLLAVCQPGSVSRTLGHFASTLLSHVSRRQRGSDSAQCCWSGLGGGNASAYFKSCKSTNRVSFLPEILNKTIPRKKKKSTWIGLLLRSFRTMLHKVRRLGWLSLALRKLILALVYRVF